MDPELYVFPKIESPALKIAASSILFAVVVAAARLLLKGPALWSPVDITLSFGPYSFSLAGWLTMIAGYALFIYASYHAWLATRQKNTVEDPVKLTATRLLDTGYFGRVRHPMYGMFILADAGLGLAMNSVYGLGFSLLALILFALNGIFEERTFLIPKFGDQYRDYIRRVPARYFTLPQAAALVLALAVNSTGLALAIL